MQPSARPEQGLDRVFLNRCRLSTKSVGLQALKSAKRLCENANITSSIYQMVGGPLWT